MSEQWYYAKGENKHGPVEFSKLQQMATSGDLLPTELVWTDSMDDWAAAETIDRLSFGAAVKVSRKSYSFHCPECGERIAVPPNFKKDEVTCAACSKTVSIPDRDVDVTKQSEVDEELDEWYYAKDDRQHGPIEFSQLQKMASSGKFGPSDLVWNQEMKDWIAAGKVDELSFCAADSPDSKLSESTSLPTSQADADATLWRTAKTWLPAAVVGVAAIALWLIGWSGVIQLSLLGVIALLAYWLADEIRRHASAGNSPDKSELQGALVIFVGLIVACALTLVTHWLGWRVPFLICVWTSIVATAVVAVFSILGVSKVEEPSEKSEVMVFGTVLAGLSLLLVLAAFSLSQYRPPALHLEDLSKAAPVILVSWRERDVGYESGHGSAFVHKLNGDKLVLLTNSHCLGLRQMAVDASRQADRTANISSFKMEVQFSSGKKRRVERIGESTDLNVDSACLEVSAKGLVEGEDFVLVPTVEDALEELDVDAGDEVIAVGTPAHVDLAESQTFGRVSAIRVHKNDPAKVRWIQHDATITGGNSGGPLFLRDGDKAYWIGTNTEMLPGTSISFALASEEASETEYKWADANPTGAADLINKVYGVAAVVGDQMPRVASSFPKSFSPKRSLFDPEKDLANVKAPSFFDRYFTSEFPFVTSRFVGICVFLLMWLVYPLIKEARKSSPLSGLPESRKSPPTSTKPNGQ